jgi:hypothetical protein
MLFRVQNFQSIKDETFEFKGLTAIVGPSDRGKSALQRALKSLLYNEWDESYLRRGEKKCILTLTLSEGLIYQIIKEKSKSVNTYTFTFRDGTPNKVYPKIGKNIPEEIKALGFDIIETERGDKFNLNFQEQLDPLFLVAQPDPEVTGFFNHLFKVTKYEQALRRMTSNLVKLKQSNQTNDENILNKNGELKIIQENLSILELRIDYLTRLQNAYVQTLLVIQVYGEDVLKLKEIESFTKIILEVKNKINIIEKTLNIISNYKEKLSLYFSLNKDLFLMGELNQKIFSLIQEENKLNYLRNILIKYLHPYPIFLDLIFNIEKLINLEQGVRILDRNLVELKGVNSKIMNYSISFKEYFICLKYIQSLNNLNNIIYTKNGEIEKLNILNLRLSQYLQKGGELFYLIEYLNRLCKINRDLFEYTLEEIKLKDKNISLSRYLKYLEEFKYLENYSFNLKRFKEEVISIEGVKNSLITRRDDLITYNSFIKDIIKICPLCNSNLREK